MNALFYDLKTVEVEGNTKNYAAMYSELVVNKADRNEKTVDLGASLFHSDTPTLILVKQIEHGKILQELFLTRHGLDVPFANGQDGQNRIHILAFNLREFPVLIGTCGVIGEGVDTKPCEWVILAGGGKSKNQFMQNCGRGFRIYPGKKECNVVLFREPSSTWFLTHFEACVGYLKEEYNIEPIQI